jgi:hypothetical protein
MDFQLTNPVNVKPNKVPNNTGRLAMTGGMTA